MAIRALDFVTKVSSRLVYEILPVAVASVVGAMLVNQYGRQPASPPIVIQAQPSASEDAMVQSLREERELIASFVKRNQAGGLDAGGSASAATQVASVSPLPVSVADPPLPEPRPAAQKAVLRPAPKAAGKKKPAPAEGPLPQPEPDAIAIETPLLLATLPPATRIEPEPRPRPIVRIAGALGGWVADVAQAPARVAFLPRWSDWSSAPPLIRRLSFFQQN
jgi:hypothetical protein